MKKISHKNRNQSAAYGFHDENKCQHCGEPKATFAHVLWTCPSLQTQREECLNKLLPGINASMLHPAMLFGIAPSMTATHDTTFWGRSANDLFGRTKKLLGVGDILTTQHDDGTHYHALTPDAITTVESILNEHGDQK